MYKPSHNQTGLTLVEILVAMIISVLSITALYTLFQVHHRMAIKQEETTLMQQELLTAISLIAEELRMCGYSPTGAPGFGFANRPNRGEPDYGRATNETSVYCTLDSQGDGKIDESGSGSMRDHVGFRLNVLNSGGHKNDADNVLRKYDTGAVRWQPQSSNIGSLRFVYFDDQGQIVVNPEKNPDLIKIVEIHITAEPSKERALLDIGKRSMTTRVVCRNLLGQ